MKSFFTSFFIAVSFFVPSVFAEGNASLSIFPPTGTHKIGDIFHVLVNVDTDGKPINAVEGKISFDKNELEVTGLSKDGSILESWTTEPAYSNEEGTVSFGGGVKSFIGNSGKIISVDFRALKNAETKVRFSTGDAILSADGLGTNILTLMNAGVYTVIPREVIPSNEPIGFLSGTPTVLGAATSTEEKITITSSSHSDENKWYKDKVAKFQWNLPIDVTAVRLLADSSSSTLRTKRYSPPVAEKTIRDISDGISYFHLQVKRDFGWSEPEIYRFQTDTEKPEIFQIKEASSSNPFSFFFEAHDKTSGIEKYLIQIDNGKEIEWGDDGSHKYIPEEQDPGPHILSVKAVDFAGNFATSSLAFTLESINPPTITDFQKTILPGSALVVRGKGEPNTALSLWVSKDGGHRVESIITTDSGGRFTFFLNGKTEEGTYKIYAEEKGRGVRSAPSAEVFVMVSQPGFILFGKTAIDYLSILIPLVTLVILLIFILVFGWYRFKVFRTTLQKEMEEVGTVSREVFSSLRKEVQEDERVLDEKDEKKKQVVKRLKKSIDVAEAYIEKEISDAKEKVKPPVKVKARKLS